MEFTEYQQGTSLVADQLGKLYQRAKRALGDALLPERAAEIFAALASQLAQPQKLTLSTESGWDDAKNRIHFLIGGWYVQPPVDLDAALELAVTEIALIGARAEYSQVIVDALTATPGAEVAQ